MSTLPNPFQFKNGSMVKNKLDWKKRREELAEAIQYDVYGCTLKPESLTYEVNTSDTANLTIQMKQNSREAGFSASVYVPTYGEDTEIQAPYPVLIVIGSVTESQRNELLKHGYAVVNMPTAPVYSDDKSRSGAYTTLFPYMAGEYELDSGALMAWGWGVSRIIDALEQGAFPDIHPQQTVVTGVSRNGKAALLAGAFDTRIAVTVPVDSGQAGASSFRYHVEGRIYHYVGNPFPDGMGRSEKINNMTGAFPHWFSSQIARFAYREEELPFDTHSILSLAAPRPLLLFGGEEFDWLSQPAAVLSYTAAKEVYEFLDAGESIALHIRKGAHAIQNRDIPIIIDFANHALRGCNYKLSKDRFPYEDTYNQFEYVADSCYIPWSRPGKYKLWTETEQIIAGMPVNVTAYTNADTVTLQPPSSGWDPAEPVTVTVENGEAVFKLTAEQAKAGKYTLTASGDKHDRHTVGFLGTPWDHAFKTTLTRDGNHRIIHFADRYDKNAARVLVNGVDITDVHDPVRFRGEEMNRQVYFMNYGIRICHFTDVTPDAHGAYRIVIENLHFQNFLPDQTFRYSHVVSAQHTNMPELGGAVWFTSGADSGLSRQG